MTGLAALGFQADYLLTLGAAAKLVLFGFLFPRTQRHLGIS